MKIPKDEKRIMEVFNVSDYNRIPKRTNKSVKFYFEFLKKRLVFPITGEHTWEHEAFTSETLSVKLHNLSDLCDDFYGILAEGRVGRKKVVVPLVDFEPENEKDENFQLIDDYKTWFCNW